MLSNNATDSTLIQDAYLHNSMNLLTIQQGPVNELSENLTELVRNPYDCDAF